MKFYSTRDRKLRVTFKEALNQGLSSDLGLFMPEYIPLMGADFFSRLPRMSMPEIAFEVGSKYIAEEIPSSILRTISNEAFNFPVGLKQIEERKYVLELFNGPTAAFKDFGARFMSQCFKYFSEADNYQTVVLVATSGDTGGAIANSFFGIEGVDVIILYPSQKVSLLQENQMTTYGKNITALEIDGTFDDCQSMVKSAFVQLETNGKIRLTSANSINIARLIPQSFYYYYAIGHTGNDKKVLSVPSGNFGNITGAVMAWKSGLPVERFIASTNINKAVPDYLMTGLYNPAASVKTIANAMDVGNPSNFERLLEIFDHDWERIISMVSGYWFDDDQIRQHISYEYKKTGYILDPHGAVASLGLDRYLNDNRGSSGIIIETAHPAKFCDIVEPVIHRSLDMPDSLKIFLSGKKKSHFMKPGYRFLEEYLKDRYKL